MMRRSFHGYCCLNWMGIFNPEGFRAFEIMTTTKIKDDATSSQKGLTGAIVRLTRLLKY